MSVADLQAAANRLKIVLLTMVAMFYAYDLASILLLILPSILIEHWSYIKTLDLKMICVIWMF
jgi:hypothetical protein